MASLSLSSLLGDTHGVVGNLRRRTSEECKVQGVVPLRALVPPLPVFKEMGRLAHGGEADTRLCQLHTLN